jgi:hypothetical protein
MGGVPEPDEELAVLMGADGDGPEIPKLRPTAK